MINKDIQILKQKLNDINRQLLSLEEEKKLVISSIESECLHIDIERIEPENQFDHLKFKCKDCFMFFDNEEELIKAQKNFNNNKKGYFR